MPKLKKGTRLPTAKEDATITKAAKSDPDAQPFTEAAWKKAKVRARIGPARWKLHPSFFIPRYYLNTPLPSAAATSASASFCNKNFCATALAAAFLTAAT